MNPRPPQSLLHGIWYAAPRILNTQTKPTGCGESPIGPVAPAIANAFYSLTEVRLRQMPRTAGRVLNALNSLK